MTAEGSVVNASDEEKIAEFCAAAYPQLVGALAHHTGDVLLAEELAQEALLRACRRWSHVRGLASPVGWTYRVGANLAASTFRRRAAEQRANRRAAQQLSADREPATAEHLAVREALRSLTPRQRQAVVLRHYFGLSAEETAALVGGTGQGVRALTHRAVAALRADLTDTDAEQTTTTPPSSEEVPDVR